MNLLTANLVQNISKNFQSKFKHKNIVILLLLCCLVTTPATGLLNIIWGTLILSLFLIDEQKVLGTIITSIGVVGIILSMVSWPLVPTWFPIIPFFLISYGILFYYGAIDHELENMAAIWLVLLVILNIGIRLFNADFRHGHYLALSLFSKESFFPLANLLENPYQDALVNYERFKAISNYPHDIKEMSFLGGESFISFAKGSSIAIIISGIFTALTVLMRKKLGIVKEWFILLFLLPAIVIFPYGREVYILILLWRLAVPLEKFQAIIPTFLYVFIFELKQAYFTI